MNESTFVVVGGSSGIGLDITRRLSRKNHSVAVVSRSADSLSGLPGVTHLPLDITRDAIARDAIPAAVQGLAYCPGSIRLRPFHRLKEEDFLADWRINFFGAVNAIQSCLPALKKASGSGSVVLFSTVAVGTGMPFHASIASAKGALEGLTRSLAAEFAPRIRVNAVAPSLTDTPLAGTLLSDEGRRSAAAERHPLKRFGKARDAAAAATFLLEESAAWITGQVIAVDGGMGSVRTFK
ncbi:oxidoreductase [Desulfosarcina alkanivorans]|uniref:Oxidoreductase n=1 Tax=Desulfosarcina alkanivorans TaxID=571177 RepID=A0A5K7YJ54_9BACT|nr:SDR family oxidoreductase [Desulfosarcina alkanivorans]BBO68948.1 oxidoreductase [Desulfosarcina alkanivorans]